MVCFAPRPPIYNQEEHWFGTFVNWIKDWAGWFEKKIYIYISPHTWRTLHLFLSKNIASGIWILALSEIGFLIIFRFIVKPYLKTFLKSWTYLPRLIVQWMSFKLHVARQVWYPGSEDGKVDIWPLGVKKYKMQINPMFVWYRTFFALIWWVNGQEWWRAETKLRTGTEEDSVLFSRKTFFATAAKDRCM